MKTENSCRSNKIFTLTLERHASLTNKGETMKIIKLLLTLALFACLAATAFGGNSQESTKSRAYIEARFAIVLNGQLGVELERLSDDTRFREELSADELDLMELLMAIEEYFDIVVTDAQWEGVTTIREALDLIYDIKN